MANPFAGMNQKQQPPTTESENPFVGMNAPSAVATPQPDAFTANDYGSLDPKDVTLSGPYNQKQLTTLTQGLPTPEKEELGAAFGFLNPEVAKSIAAGKQGINDRITGLGSAWKLMIETFAKDYEEAKKRTGTPEDLSFADIMSASTNRAWRMTKGAPPVVGGALFAVGKSMVHTATHPIETLKEDPITFIEDASVLGSLAGSLFKNVALRAGIKAPLRAPFVPSIAKVTDAAGHAYTDVTKVIPRTFSLSPYESAKQLIFDKVTGIPLIHEKLDAALTAKEAVRMVMDKNAVKLGNIERYQKAWKQALGNFDDDMMGVLREEFELPISKADAITAKKAGWSAEKVNQYEAGAETAKDIARNYENELIESGLMDEMRAAKTAWLAEAQTRINPKTGKTFLTEGEDFTDEILDDLLNDMPDMVKEARPVKAPVGKTKQLVGEGKILENVDGKAFEVQGVYSATEELTKAGKKKLKKLAPDAPELEAKGRKWVVLRDMETGDLAKPVAVGDIKGKYQLQDEITWYQKKNGPTYFHHDAVKDAATFKEATRALWSWGRRGGLPGPLHKRTYGPWATFAKHVPRGFKAESNIAKAQTSAVRKIESWKSRIAMIRETNEKFAKPVGPSGRPDKEYVFFNPSNIEKQAVVNMKVMDDYAARLTAKKSVQQSIDETIDYATDTTRHEELLRGALPPTTGAAADGVMQIPKSVAKELEHAFGIEDVDAAWLFHDDILKAVRYSQLAMSPRWMINNAIGNAVLSGVSGNFGWVTGWVPGTKRNRLIKQGLKEGLLPDEVVGRSLSKAELGDVDMGVLAKTGLQEFGQYLGNTLPGKYVKMWGDFVTSTNDKVEAFSRANAYLDKIKDEAVRTNIIDTGRKFAMMDTLATQLDDLRRVADSPELVKKYTDYVNKVLFDYSTLTSVERRGFRRVFMYWTWQKSITRRFWQLPIEEPLKARILAEFALISADEVRDDEQPNWMMDSARLYLDPRTGETKLLPLRAKNPFESAIVPTEESIGRIVSQANPIFKTFVEWSSGYDFFKQRRYQGLEGDKRPSLPELALRNFPQYGLLESAISGFGEESAMKLYSSVGLGQLIATKLAIARGDPDAIDTIAVQGENGEIIKKPFPDKLAGILFSLGTFSSNLTESKKYTLDNKRRKASKLVNRMIVTPSKRNPEKWDRFLQWFALLDYDPQVEFERALDDFLKDFKNGDISKASLDAKIRSAKGKLKIQKTWKRKAELLYPPESKDEAFMDSQKGVTSGRR